VLADPGSHERRRAAELLGRLGERGDRADADVLPLERLEPFGEGAREEDPGELERERVLVGVVLVLGELRTAEGVASNAPTVSARPSAVA
jgi:hypothetical protein